MFTAFIIVLVVVVTFLTVMLVTMRQYTCAPLVTHGNGEAEEKHPQ